MKSVVALFAILLAPVLGQAQNWQSITPTGAVRPSFTVYTNSVWDTQHQTLLMTQDDAARGSGIYADGVWSFNPVNGAWALLWVDPAGANQLCPGDTSTRPQHRHTYNQFTWDTLRNQAYITAGSCLGALSYDFYAFTHAGSAGSGNWTQMATTTPNTNTRQEGAMVYMPNVDRVLLYGGFTGANGAAGDDTWEYNPATNAWTLICTGCAPGTRHAHLLVYDDASGKVIIWGGQRCFGCADINLTYLYDPVKKTWAAANPIAEAPASSFPCHGYDKQRKRLVMYPTVGQVWSYTTASNTWTQLSIGGVAPSTDLGGGNGNADSFCGYDSAHDWFLLFNGANGAQPNIFGLNFGVPVPPDTTLPTVSMTAPAASAAVSGIATVSANASDNIAVVGVQFQLDGVNLGAEDTVAPYSVSWNTTTATNASHTLSAIARDAAGNKATASVTVTVSNQVDTTPPVVAISAPGPGNTVSGSITVSATASDNIGVGGVQFQLDGANLGVESTTAPYSVTWDTTKASNGPHTLSAIARDAVGNKSTATVAVTVSNVVIPPGSIKGVGVDASTTYSVELKELAPLVTCPTCWFATGNDVMSGQTLEVRVRPGSNPAIADQIILKQGALDGSINSVGTNQFVLTPAAGNLWPASVTVVTGSAVTQFVGFTSPSGPVQTGQRVSVRGLLFKSTPSGIQLIAGTVELHP